MGRATRIVGMALVAGYAVAAAAQPVKIGMVTEQTGANAEYGQESARGLTLAVDEVNRAGGVLGRPLEVVREDNQSTNPGSVVAVSRLLAQSEVKAVITTLRSAQAVEMMPEIARAGIPALTGGSSVVLTRSNNPWMFRVLPHEGHAAKAIADFGVNTLKKKRWAIVHSIDSFGIDARDRLAEELKALGAPVVAVHGVNTTAQNFAPVVLALRKVEVDIVAVHIPSAVGAGTFASQLRQGGVDAPMIGGQSISSAVARRIAGEALHGTYAIYNFVADASPRAKAFARQFSERWGTEPDLRSSWVYDSVHLLALAINQAGSTKPNAIRSALLSIRNYPGAQGSYSFDAHGDGLHGFHITKNDDGKIVFVKSVSFADR